MMIKKVITLIIIIVVMWQDNLKQTFIFFFEAKVKNENAISRAIAKLLKVVKIFVCRLSGWRKKCFVEPFTGWKKTVSLWGEI